MINFLKNNNLNNQLIFLLVLFHTFIIAVSNYLVTIHFNLWDLKLTLAAFTFPLIVIATDLTVRLVDKVNARAIIGIAFIPAILASMWVIYMSGAPLSVATRIGVASGCAYLVSNLLDVYVFQKIREKMTLWFWAPGISAIFANIIDTFTFFFVAFYQSQNSYMAANWFAIAWGQTGVKVIISLMVILPLYGILLSFIQRHLQKKLKSD